MYSFNVPNFLTVSVSPVRQVGHQSVSWRKKLHYERRKPEFVVTVVLVVEAVVVMVVVVKVAPAIT